MKIFKKVEVLRQVWKDIRFVDIVQTLARGSFSSYWNYNVIQKFRNIDRVEYFEKHKEQYNKKKIIPKSIIELTKEPDENLQIAHYEKLSVPIRKKNGFIMTAITIYKDIRASGYYIGLTKKDKEALERFRKDLKKKK